MKKLILLLMFGLTLNAVGQEKEPVLDMSSGEYLIKAVRQHNIALIISVSSLAVAGLMSTYPNTEGAMTGIVVAGNLVAFVIQIVSWQNIAKAGKVLNGVTLESNRVGIKLNF